MASSSLNAENKPSWPITRFLKGVFGTRIEPEIYEQSQGITMNKFGIVNAVRTKSGHSQFGEFSDSGNQFAIPAPGGGSAINTSKALANNKGFVYAAVNAKAREVMNIDWRLFEVDGEDHKEQTEHELLDLLDSVNDNMTGLELKYLISACLDLTGNAYIWLEGVKNDTDKPKAIHLMPPDKVVALIDRRSWPYQLVGYKMRLENSVTDMQFQPYEVVHLRLPNPKNFFEGLSPVEAGAEYIDNDNYAMEFNRKFFINGARPAGFLKSELQTETQLEVLKVGFANMHEGVDNMNRIAVLPKGVEWQSSGSNPKDMDFKNMSEDMRDRILSMFGVSRTILGTAESDTNRACYDSETEVLTENGWKKYFEVKDGEKIAEYDPNGDVIRFVEPLGSYVYKYKGAMVQFVNDETEIMVTPDHRMWFRPDGSSEYRIGFAHEIDSPSYFKTAIENSDGSFSVEETHLDHAIGHIDYDSYVWCFRTKTGLFVTRRNGKIALQGNTAETADYVFSKRVIKPHMTLICSFLNERLVPRYADNLYITFIDPVPEDKAFRTTEMQAAVGSQPVLTPNEARDEFMGMGPVEGGDDLYVSTSFQPVGEPQEETDVDPDAKPNTEPTKEPKSINKGFKGDRIAFRPARTKLQKRAAQRKLMAEGLKDRIKAVVEEALEHTSFSTKETDEAMCKAATERTSKAEAEIKETIIKLNAEQKKEVLQNLPNVVKAIDPTKLFDLDNWISITTSAVTPIMESLFEQEGKAAAEEIGKPLNPLSDTLAKEALHESIAKMSTSYNQTTLATLEVKINDGLTAGDGIADITKTVEEIYEWSDTWRAERVAKTEAFRTTNASLKAAWQQSGVVKTIKWYTSSAEPCDFCEALNGKVIGINDVFFKNGESITVGEGDNAKTMSLDYGDVGAPPLHPNCLCIARPDSVSLD